MVRRRVQFILLSLVDYIIININQTVLFEEKIIKQFLLGKFYVDGNDFCNHKLIISGIIKWKRFYDTNKL